MTYLTDWRSNFRYPTYRKGQESATDKIATFLDSGSRFVVADIPTGIGKSDIAMALARSSGSAYIATPQNLLIDQYNGDFSKYPFFWYIKGRNNYECTSDPSQSCRTGSDNHCNNFSHKEDGSVDNPNDFHEGEPEPDHEEMQESGICPYKRNRNKAASRKVALTNLTYFSMGLKSSKWAMRDIAIIDESHNLAGEIMSQVSLDISDRTLQGLRLKTLIKDTYSDKEVIDGADFRSFLDKIVSESAASIASLKDEFAKITFAKEIEEMGELIDKVKWFERSIEAGVQWVVQAKKEDKYATITAKPLHVNFFAQNMFFAGQAKQYLLQSATIINPKKYTEELGIEAYGYVEESSPFDLNRYRPVFLMESGKMSYKELDGTFPKAIIDVARVIESYFGRRGVIHTTSYAVQKRLHDVFSNNGRCIFMTPENKNEALIKYATTPGAVLFSPALMEGFDGKGDLLRFQVLMRTPHAPLGDLQIKMKADLDQEWYTWQTVKTVIQCLGRGMRSEDDWCDTYVIDSNFANFAGRSLPLEIKNTIVSSAGARDSHLRRRALQIN